MWSSDHIPLPLHIIYLDVFIRISMSLSSVHLKVSKVYSDFLSMKPAPGGKTAKLRTWG